jgi:hypothetical protein
MSNKYIHGIFKFVNYRIKILGRKYVKFTKRQDSLLFSFNKYVQAAPIPDVCRYTK